MIGMLNGAWAQPSVSSMPHHVTPNALPASPPPGLGVSEQDAILLTAARQAAQMADQGKFGAMWDGASIVAKKAVGRDPFIQHMEQNRRQLGPIVARNKGSISRVKYGQGAQVPAGLYVNISFPTRFAHADQIIRELVSFRLDEDKVWRLVGYHVQMPVQKPSTSAVQGAGDAY